MNKSSEIQTSEFRPENAQSATFLDTDFSNFHSGHKISFTFPGSICSTRLAWLVSVQWLCDSQQWQMGWRWLSACASHYWSSEPMQGKLSKHKQEKQADHRRYVNDRQRNAKLVLLACDFCSCVELSPFRLPMCESLGICVKRIRKTPELCSAAWRERNRACECPKYEMCLNDPSSGMMRQQGYCENRCEIGPGVRTSVWKKYRETQ